MTPNRIPGFLGMTESLCELRIACKTGVEGDLIGLNPRGVATTQKQFRCLIVKIGGFRS
jgi:hypothetical protein